MSKISDKKFILIIVLIGIIYFLYQYKNNNDNVELPKVSFLVDGETKTLADYKGQKLVVNFYASWCRPCMEELPAMAKTDSEWGNVVFLWLNDENEEVINKSKNQFGRETFYLMTNSFKDIGIASIPYTVFINEKGEVVFTENGQLKWEDESFKMETLSRLQ